uniref:Trafficking protein particle complex subunit 4 n=1 Tax=Setaria digitata TaxID=48799 RepID=A0A915PJL4_9BILA
METGILGSDNPFFYLCCDWLEEVSNRGILDEMKNEINNFTSTLLTQPYYYYAGDFFFDSASIIKELRCLDLTYLMERRLRHTRIREELEQGENMGRFRKKCTKCLRESDDEGEGHSKQKKEDSESSEDANEAKVSKTADSERTDQNVTGILENRKKRKKKKPRINDLNVVDRFWFKRDTSPPPKDELEKHLHELRVRTRNELHTLLFLNRAVQESKTNLLRKYMAVLNQKDRRSWNRFLNYIETRFEIIPDEPTEYNKSSLSECLKNNPELMKAMDKMKVKMRAMSKTVPEEMHELATKIERQLFSLIPGVPGLTVYRNVMSSPKMSKEEPEGSNDEGTSDAAQSSTSFEPFFEPGPSLGHTDSSISTAPSASITSSASDAPRNLGILPDETVRPVLENVSVADLWGQYVKCLMMAVPSNLGRANFDRTAGMQAEKFLEQILKLSPVTSTMCGEPLQVPCFNPGEEQQISDGEKYKVELLKATKADSELIWNTAAQLQALVLIRRGKGPAVGLNELRKFNAAMQEAADTYREALASSQDRSVSRVGNFQYRISYGGKTETYHADAMRTLILNQLPPAVRFFTDQTKSEKLKKQGIAKEYFRNPRRIIHRRQITYFLLSRYGVKFDEQSKTQHSPALQPCPLYSFSYDSVCTSPMLIQHVFIINRAGSLIYDWDGKVDCTGVEKTFSYPLDIVLDIVDQKITVIFGERDGIGLRYTVSAINGTPVQACKVMFNGVEKMVLDIIQEEANYPLSIRFQSPTITTNEKIILSSTFHSLYTIAAQLSPVLKSSGIEVLSTNHFKLYCYQSTTGVKFVVVGSLSLISGVDGLLRRIYELYADFALKNPFYSIDMPIRCQKFDDAMRSLIERQDKFSMLTI